MKQCSLRQNKKQFFRQYRTMWKKHNETVFVENKTKCNSLYSSLIVVVISVFQKNNVTI